LAQSRRKREGRFRSASGAIADVSGQGALGQLLTPSGPKGTWRLASSPRSRLRSLVARQPWADGSWRSFVDIFRYEPARSPVNAERTCYWTPIYDVPRNAPDSRSSAAAAASLIADMTSPAEVWCTMWPTLRTQWKVLCLTSRCSLADWRSVSLNRSLSPAIITTGIRNFAYSWCAAKASGIMRAASAAPERSWEGRTANSLVKRSNVLDTGAGPNNLSMSSGQINLTRNGATVWLRISPTTGMAGPDWMKASARALG